MLIIRSARGKPVSISHERLNKIHKAKKLSEATHMGIWDRIKCHFLGAEKQLACTLLYRVIHGFKPEKENPSSKVIDTAFRLNHLDALEQLVVTPVSDVIEKKLEFDDQADVTFTITFKGASDLPIVFSYNLLESHLNNEFDKFKKELPQHTFEDINRLTFALRNHPPHLSKKNSRIFVQCLRSVPFKHLKNHASKVNCSCVEIPGVLPLIPLKRPFNPELMEFDKFLLEQVFPAQMHDKLEEQLEILHSSYPFKVQEITKKMEALRWIDTHLPIKYKGLLKVNVEKSSDYHQSVISHDKSGRIYNVDLGNPEYIMSYKLDGMATCMRINFGSKSDLKVGAVEARKVKLTNASGILNISEKASEVDVRDSLKQVVIERNGEISGAVVDPTKKSSTLKMLSQSTLDWLTFDQKYEYLENELRGFNFFQKFMNPGKSVEYNAEDDGADTWLPDWYMDVKETITDVRRQMQRPFYLGIIDGSKD
ncbi:hypothetical protein JQC92_13975 [Shewanella sp. 202IG2-18]|uniref:hypothetical protein n=1 Tax=Parashewanella hymeniacidonis TaxID=2807618 RepID=UPI0019613F98|nr:hypothetical protein [Parashewanella hymeniacidonis]